MRDLIPRLVCAAVAFGAIILWVSLIAFRSWVFPPPDFSAMNLGIWASGAGLKLARSRKMRSFGDRTRYKFLVETEDGRRGWGWATVPANGIDARSERVEIVWQQAVPTVRPAEQVQDDPLWDDGLDGGPVA